MELNLKQPKYVLPLIALPFFCLFFYVFHSGSAPEEKSAVKTDQLNGAVGNVAEDVRRKNLATKLDAFRNTYKDGSGASAVSIIPSEASANPAFDDYGIRQRAKLDSLNREMKVRLSGNLTAPRPENEDRLMAEALANLQKRRKESALPDNTKAQTAAQQDPMEVFKRQMAYMDSLSKENDPAYKAEKLKKQQADDLQKARAGEVRFTVSKASAADEGFNTVRPGRDQDFIKAIIDENETGYAGSRLRLRLLEDIRTAGYLVPKGTYLYALVSGFSQQRVTLAITSIMAGGKIFPVKLGVYDLDGLPGLYVPESAFRDFTKDLSGSTMQGVSLDGASGNQFIMSSVGHIFQSTSSAITELIRKNKAKMKYGTYIYLIDSEALQAEQKSY